MLRQVGSFTRFDFLDVSSVCITFAMGECQITTPAVKVIGVSRATAERDGARAKIAAGVRQTAFGTGSFFKCRRRNAKSDASAARRLRGRRTVAATAAA